MSTLIHRSPRLRWNTQALVKIAACEEGDTRSYKDHFRQFEARGGGALGYFLGGYVPPGTPNWHPVLEKISPKIDTPF